MSKHRKTDLDLARDELMSHIHRCGVLQAAQEHQVEWMEDTMDYLSELYPALNASELGELKEIGLRFCQPVIPHGKGHSALTAHDENLEGDVTTEESEADEVPVMASA